MPQSYCSFDSTLGRIFIAWSDKGIICLQLPEETDEATLAQLKKRLPKAEPAEPNAIAKNAIQLICEHLQGQRQDFSSISLDLSSSSEFSRRVYEAARTIKAGQVASYSEIAAKISAPDASRAVGRALGSNPVAIIIPCHRVIGKNGSMTGFSAYGSLNTKMRLLSIEKGLSSDKLTLAGLT